MSNDGVRAQKHGRLASVNVIECSTSKDRSENILNNNNYKQITFLDEWAAVDVLSL